MKLIPLVPDTKTPAVRGWAKDSYETPALPEGGLHAVRLDDYVVVDCDDRATADAWRTDPDANADGAFEVRTPRGSHFYYARGEDDRSSIGVIPGKLDVKAGKGAYAVAYWHEDDQSLADFPEPSELADYPRERINQLKPARPADADPLSGWDTVPEGARNSTLASIGGGLRKQGAGPQAIANTLATFNKRHCAPPLSEDEIKQIVFSVCRYEPEPDVTKITLLDEDPAVGGLPVRYIETMSEKDPPPFLWDPYIPQSRFVLVDGAEGIGKSMFCARLAVMVTSGSTQIDPTPVLWLPAEDDPEEDIMRRLRAAGYRVGEHPTIGFIEPSAFTAGSPDLVKQLEILIEQTGAKLVILDPVRSFLKEPGAKDYSNNNDAQVRPALEALSRLAHRSGATILGTHHWRKNIAEGVKNAATGSAGFSQVARHRISLAWVGTTELGAGALAISKSNIAPTGKVYGYKIEQNDEGIPVFRLTKPQPDTDLDAWLTRQRKALDTDEDGDTISSIVLVQDDAVLGEMLSDPTRYGHRITRKVVREIVMNLFGDTQAAADATYAQICKFAEVGTHPLIGREASRGQKGWTPVLTDSKQLEM